MKNRISLLLILLAISFSIHAQKVMRIGIIGLDTSHSTAFTELINSGSDETFSKGFRVVAAYPYGSKTIQSSYERIPGYIEKVKANGVEITSSIADLLEKVDCVLLETNDGRLHLEQAVEVFKSGKICYIDKPVGATLGDAIAIYEMAEKYNAPVFSSSALRFTPQNQKLRNGEFWQNPWSRLLFSSQSGANASGFRFLWHSWSRNIIHNYGNRMRISQPDVFR